MEMWTEKDKFLARSGDMPLLPKDIIEDLSSKFRGSMYTEKLKQELDFYRLNWAHGVLSDPDKTSLVVKMFIGLFHGDIEPHPLNVLAGDEVGIKGTLEIESTDSEWKEFIKGLTEGEEQ